jgi:hypothetical protein
MAAMRRKSRFRVSSGTSCSTATAAIRQSWGERMLEAAKKSHAAAGARTPAEPRTSSREPTWRTEAQN